MTLASAWMTAQSFAGRAPSAPSAPSAPEPDACTSCRGRGHVADRLVDGRWRTLNVGCILCGHPGEERPDEHREPRYVPDPPPSHVALWLARLHSVEADAIAQPYAYPPRELTDEQREQVYAHDEAAREAEALAMQLGGAETDEEREALRDAAWQSWIGGAA